MERFPVMGHAQEPDDDVTLTTGPLEPDDDVQLITGPLVDFCAASPNPTIGLRICIVSVAVLPMSLTVTAKGGAWWLCV